MQFRKIKIIIQCWLTALNDYYRNRWFNCIFYFSFHPDKSICHVTKKSNCCWDSSSKLYPLNSLSSNASSWKLILWCWQKCKSNLRPLIVTNSFQTDQGGELAHTIQPLRPRHYKLHLFLSRDHLKVQASQLHTAPLTLRSCWTSRRTFVRHRQSRKTKNNQDHSHH